MVEYIGCCVNLEAEFIEGLIDNCEDTTCEEFKEGIGEENYNEISKSLGYNHPNLTLANDWHVRFAKSNLEGKTYFYVTHSAIEYIFEN